MPAKEPRQCPGEIAALLRVILTSPKEANSRWEQRWGQLKVRWFLPSSTLRPPSFPHSWGLTSVFANIPEPSQAGSVGHVMPSDLICSPTRPNFSHAPLFPSSGTLVAKAIAYSTVA